ncbi:hypothetical protein XAC3608_1970004 [Xanthomonas citri pv. citri]|nr:hypothetical protein XAC3608_1970004 [Xanthomonas citri pv. citri]
MGGTSTTGTALILPVQSPGSRRPTPSSPSSDMAAFTSGPGFTSVRWPCIASPPSPARSPLAAIHSAFGFQSRSIGSNRSRSDSSQRMSRSVVAAHEANSLRHSGMSGVTSTRWFRRSIRTNERIDSLPSYVVRSWSKCCCVVSTNHAKPSLETSSGLNLIPAQLSVWYPVPGRS